MRPGTTLAASMNVEGRSCAHAAGATRSATVTDVWRIMLACTDSALRRRECQTCVGNSPIEPSHRADRAAGAALDLQRKADEAKAALADELVEIDEPLDMREAEIAAD